MRKQRNDTLSVLKLFAAYMVVFIHVPFYGRIGVAVMPWLGLLCLSFSWFQAFTPTK